MLLPVWLAAGAVLSPLIPSLHAAQFPEIAAPDDGIHSLSVGMTEDAKPGTVSPTRSRVSSFGGQIAVAVSVTALLLGLMLLVRLMAGGKPVLDSLKRRGAPRAGPDGPAAKLGEPQPSAPSKDGEPEPKTSAKSVGEPTSPSGPAKRPSPVREPQPEHGARSAAPGLAQQEQDSSDSDTSEGSPVDYSAGTLGGSGKPRQQPMLKEWTADGVPEDGEGGKGEPLQHGGLDFTPADPTQGSPQPSPPAGHSPQSSRSPSPPPRQPREPERPQLPSTPVSSQAQYDAYSSEDESLEGEVEQPTPPSPETAKRHLPVAQQLLQRWNRASLFGGPPKRNAIPDDAVGKIGEQQGD